jgi:hypothetical protein
MAMLQAGFYSFLLLTIRAWETHARAQIVSKVTSATDGDLRKVEVDEYFGGDFDGKSEDGVFADVETCLWVLSHELGGGESSFKRQDAGI